MQPSPRSADSIRDMPLSAPITTVTLLEDRAQIKRVGKAYLEPGLWHLRVEQVAPVLVDKSLRAEFLQQYSGARVDDVRVQRQMLVKESEQPEALQSLKAEIRSLQQRFNHTGEDRRQRELSFAQLQTILQKALVELPIDAAWGQVNPQAWREQLMPLFQRLRELRGEVQETFQTQDSLWEQIQDISQRLTALYRPDLIYTAALEADLTITQPGEYGLAFHYVVPNALWRPTHQARLFQRDGTLRTAFRVDGCVWQRTGEDWEDVELVFSTARASLGTEPPVLTDDRLNVQEKTKQVTLQTREQQVQTTGLGTGATPDTLELPGVDDGGEVQNLRSATRSTIPSDGRPYRVPIFAFESSATIDYVLMPEISSQVVLKSTQTNTTTFPILAGPVDLIRTSGFVGRTSILFIAPGEQFALGWGPEEALRIQRVVQTKQEQDALTRWRSKTTTVRLFLSNIGAEARQVTTIERVPVSELEQVKVEVLADKTTQKLQADENGFCTWIFHLEPYTQQQAELVYKVSVAPDVQGF